MAAVTGTCSLASTGILTAGAPSGGVYEVGMSITNAGISQPQSPAVKITSQLSGTTGLAGTYQTNLVGSTIASSAFTFVLWQTAQNAPINGCAPIAQSSARPPPILPSFYGLKPPQPLPQSVFGSTVQNSYSS